MNSWNLINNQFKSLIIREVKNEKIFKKWFVRLINEWSLNRNEQ